MVKIYFVTRKRQQCSNQRGAENIFNGRNIIVLDRNNALNCLWLWQMRGTRHRSREHGFAVTTNIALLLYARRRKWYLRLFESYAHFSKNLRWRIKSDSQKYLASFKLYRKFKSHTHIGGVTRAIKLETVVEMITQYEWFFTFVRSEFIRNHTQPIYLNLIIINYIIILP